MQPDHNKLLLVLSYPAEVGGWVGLSTQQVISLLKDVHSTLVLYH